MREKGEEEEEEESFWSLGNLSHLKKDWSRNGLFYGVQRGSFYGSFEPGISDLTYTNEFLNKFNAQMSQSLVQQKQVARSLSYVSGGK